MIYNSCNFPDSCDCLDCEERNMKKSRAPQIIKNFYKSERKKLSYMERKELIKDYFSDVEFEYNEANNATNIYNMLCEVLEVMPKDILIDNNSMGLFKSALQDTTGIEIKLPEENKSKKYI